MSIRSIVLCALLATLPPVPAMADPAPAPTRDSAVATLFGEELRIADPAALREVLLTGLFDAFAAREGISVSDREVDAFVHNLAEGMRAQGLGSKEVLSAAAVAEIDHMRRETGREIIRQWKINRALHAEYGGRLIYQQLGLEPLDAYRRFLEVRRDAGDFVIHDPSIAADFWRWFSDDSIHTFVAPDSPDAANFAVPPWAPRPTTQ
jgi:hypothetical protein